MGSNPTATAKFFSALTVLLGAFGREAVSTSRPPPLRRVWTYGPKSAPDRAVSPDSAKGVRLG